MIDLSSSAVKPASFLKRLGAMFYDGILLFGILVMAGFLTGFLIEYTSGSLLENTKILDHPLYHLYLLSICFLFFYWFWAHGGQTLGMRAWKIRLVSCKEGKLSTRLSFMQILIRFIVSCFSLFLFGLGFFWALIDKRKLAWHDLASSTKIIQYEE